MTANLLHRELEALDRLDLNVLAGDEVAAVGPARAPELALDEHLARRAHDGVGADDPQSARPTPGAGAPAPPS